MTVAEETGASLANPKQQAEGEATTTNKGVDLTSAKALFEAVESNSKEDLDVSPHRTTHRSVSRLGLTLRAHAILPLIFRPTGAGDTEGPRG